MKLSTPLACLIWADQACTHSSAGRVDAKWPDHTAGTNCNAASGVGYSHSGCRVGHKPIQITNTHVSIAQIKVRQSRSRRCLCHMTPSTPLACLIWANQACSHSTAGRVDAKWRDHTAGTKCNGASGVGNSLPGCRVGHKPIQKPQTPTSALLKSR